jgi:hypothetical protein
MRGRMNENLPTYYAFLCQNTIVNADVQTEIGKSSFARTPVRRWVDVVKILLFLARKFHVP